MNRALRIKPGGAIWRWSTLPEGTRFVVRAKAATCGTTAPRMVFKLGNKVLRNVGVSRTEWTDYPVSLDQAQGTYALNVWFEKDNVATKGCERSLKVDSISLWSKVPVNQGILGSVCQATDAGIMYSAPPTGYSTTSLGNGPGYYETAAPTDRDRTDPPEGTMMLIHGGGWYTSGPGATASMRGSAELWRSHGWTVVSVTSKRACGDWLGDLLWFYDRLRSNSPGLPMCVTGHSAGGHLALLVAAHRPDVGCAISHGGPTDLNALSQQHAYDSETGGGQSTHPRWLRELAIAAFGAEALDTNSPGLLADEIGARVLVTVAARDPVTPGRQATDMAEALDVADPDVQHDAMILESGEAGWVHAKVSQAASDAAWALGFSIAAG